MPATMPASVNSLRVMPSTSKAPIQAGELPVRMTQDIDPFAMFVRVRHCITPGSALARMQSGREAQFPLHTCQIIA